LRLPPMWAGLNVAAPLILAVVALFAGGCANSSTSAAKTAASTPAQNSKTVLWNGRDISGWTVFYNGTVDPNSIWSVTDGALNVVGNPKGYLRTEKTYANYHLHVEWCWPAGAPANSNSGVFVDVSGPDIVWPQGIECQLAAGNAGQLVGTNITIPGAPFISNKYRAPKLAESSEKPIGEWNTYDIYCRGDSIEVSVNGIHQNRIEKMTATNGGAPITSGAIGLQMEGYRVLFRNIWLEPL